MKRPLDGGRSLPKAALERIRRTCETDAHLEEFREECSDATHATLFKSGTVLSSIFVGTQLGVATHEACMPN